MPLPASNPDDTARSAAERARLAAARPPHSIRPWPLPIAESPRVEAARGELTAIQDREARRARAAALAAELTADGTPLMEPDADPGQVLVSFLWHGEAPHGVLLHLNKVSDPLDPGDTALRPLAGTPLRALTLRLPADWLGSYLLCAPREPLPAPRLHAPVDRALHGALLASAFEDPSAREYAPNKHAPARFAIGRGPRAPRLRLDATQQAPCETQLAGTIPSPASGTPLALHRWSHPEASADAPAVLLLDGEVWREQYPILPELLTRIDDGTMPPLHVLLLDSGGPRQRQLDDACDARESRLLLERVRETAGLPESAPLIVAGQSLGGLFAALATTRHPDLVAAGVAQSPSLWWPSGGTFGERRGAWFQERAGAPHCAPLLLQSGTLEWDIQRDARQAAALLRAQGTLLRFDEVQGGHDVAWWQALLPDALELAITRVLSRPANEAEREMWLAAQFAGDPSILTTAHAFSFPEPLDRASIERAWSELISEAPVLSARFALLPGPHGEQLRAEHAATPPLRYAQAEDDIEEDALLSELSTTPFDPERGPLAAALLVQRSDTGASTLAIAASHLALDGYGWAIVLRRLSALANCEPGEQRGTRLRPPRHRPERDIEAPELDWWRRALTALPLPAAPAPALRQSRPRAGARLPADAPRPEPALEIAAAALAISEVHERTGRGSGTSGEPLSRVHVAVPVTGRADDELRIAQTAMNLLPITIELVPDEPGARLIERARAAWEDARTHGSTRAEAARRALLPRDDPRGTPDVLVNIIPFTHELRIGEQRAHGRVLASGPGDAPAIALRAMRDGTITLEADAPGPDGAPSPDAAAALADAFLRARERLSAPAAHEPGPRGPAGEPVPDLLEQIAARAARHPGAPAFIKAAADGSPITSCDYGTLWGRARRVAAGIRRARLGPGNVIAACIERGADGAAILLGILLSGAAFTPVPVDQAGQSNPDHAVQRRRTAEALHPDALIAPGTAPPELPAPITLDAAQLLAAEEPGPGEAFAPPPPGALAYVITTSGSTGAPKPVAIERGALSRWVVSAADYLDAAPGDRVAQFAPVHFDASLEELFVSLAQGAALAPRDERALERIGDWLDACGRLGVTILDLPTGYWHELARSLHSGAAVLPACVRTVIIGGEAASPERLREWRAAAPGVRLINSYGPTEATIVASWAEL